MRRYLIYLTVAIIAFGLSIFTIFSIYWKPEEKFVIVQKIEKIKPAKMPVQKQDDIPQKIDYSQIQPLTIKKRIITCNDAVLSIVWKKLQKEVGFTEMYEEVVRKEITNCNEIFNISFIDLNKDKTREAIVRGKGGMPVCGATGNCSMWILRKRNKNYEIVFDAGSIEEINFKHELSSNYPDLQTRYHFGAAEHFLGTYRFDGKRYRIKECVEETTSTNGEKHLVSKRLSDCQ